MNETKLTQVLAKLTKDEFTEFGKFIKSPYFNERTRLVKFYGVLKEYYPDFDQLDFTRPDVFKKLYPAEKFNDSKLRSGFTALFKLAEEYLSYSEYKANSFMIKNNLLKAFNKKGLDRLFVKALNDSENDINEHKIDILDFFFRYRELKDIEIDFNLSRDKQIIVGEKVLRREEFGVFHFMLQLMNGYADMIANHYSFKAEFKGCTAADFFECVDSEKFIGFLKKSGNRYYPVLAMNYYIVRAMSDNKNESHIRNFLKLFNKYIDTLTRRDQLTLYNRFESYLIITHHIRSSDEVGKLSFGIYKQMLAKKLYGSENLEYMRLGSFNNIFNTALQLKEFKWLDEFIGSYINKLRPELRKNILNMCKAYIEFSKGNFETALDNINRVNYEYPIYKLSVKYLMLKIYYELDWFDQLHSLIDTSKHFLSKNKLMSDAPIERYLSFIKFVGILARIKNIPDPPRLELLKREISETSNVSGKDWLLEKAGEI